MSKFYRYLKFDTDNSTIRFVGLDATIDNGVTITSGGQTITAGGQTVTAGDVKVVGGQLFAGNKVYVGGVTAAAPCLSTGTVAPAAYFAKGSLYLDTASASIYIQTATNAWTELTKSS